MFEIIGLAGVLAILLGIIHSVMGEILIFNQLRQSSVVPNLAPAPLKQRHINIVWASWHIVSILGAALGLLLILMRNEWLQQTIYFKWTIILSMAASGLLVLLATRGRHPGWFVLMLIAVLLILPEVFLSKSE